MTEGRCLCGALRYQIDGPFVDMLHCHCSMCRKHHGTPFATWAAAPIALQRLVPPIARLAGPSLGLLLFFSHVGGVEA